MNNPFNTPAPMQMPLPPATAPAAWQSVVSPPTIKIPQGVAHDKATGEIFIDPATQQPYNETKLLTDWRAAKDSLDEIKSKEMKLRQMVVGNYSNPDKETGTENVPIGNGWNVKVEKKLSFSLKSFSEHVSNYDAVQAALERIRTATRDSQGNELNPALGLLISQRLVKYTAELSVSEYKQLLQGHREIIDTVLEVKPASPTVTIVTPKEKK